MAKKIPYKVREGIISDRSSGMNYDVIASKYGYSVSGVKKIYYRYKRLGKAGLSDNYHLCGSKYAYAKDMRALITSSRKGKEGALFIRSVLQEKFPAERIPHERTIQRWWKSLGLNQPKGRPKKGKANWTNEAHDTWQIDGKERIEMGNGEEVSWINTVDEASISQLDTKLFPPENDEADCSQSSDRTNE